MLMKNAGILNLIAENPIDSVSGSRTTRTDGSCVTEADKGKTEVTS